MHTISGLLYPDHPTDTSRSVVFSIDRRDGALVIVAAPLHDGELPATLLITPDMPCHRYFNHVSHLANGTRDSAIDDAPGQAAIAGSL